MDHSIGFSLWLSCILWQRFKIIIDRRKLVYSGQSPIAPYGSSDRMPEPVVVPQLNFFNRCLDLTFHDRWPHLIIVITLLLPYYLITLTIFSFVVYFSHHHTILCYNGVSVVVAVVVFLPKAFLNHPPFFSQVSSLLLCTVCRVIQLCILHFLICLCKLHIHPIRFSLLPFLLEFSVILSHLLYFFSAFLSPWVLSYPQPFTLLFLCFPFSLSSQLFSAIYFTFSLLSFLLEFSVILSHLLYFFSASLSPWVLSYPQPFTSLFLCFPFSLSSQLSSAIYFTFSLLSFLLEFSVILSHLLYFFSAFLSPWVLSYPQPFTLLFLCFPFSLSSQLSSAIYFTFSLLSFLLEFSVILSHLRYFFSASLSPWVLTYPQPFTLLFLCFPFSLSSQLSSAIYFTFSLLPFLLEFSVILSHLLYFFSASLSPWVLSYPQPFTLLFLCFPFSLSSQLSSAIYFTFSLLSFRLLVFICSTTASVTATLNFSLSGTTLVGFLVHSEELQGILLEGPD